MGSYAILQPGNIAAKTLDSLVKTAKCSTGALENGNVVSLGALTGTAGEAEVYVAATPATASLETAIYYMVYTPPVVVTNAQFKGLSDDPTDFNLPTDTLMSVFKPKVGDEIIISEDGLAGTKSSNTYVVPANGTGELTWAANASGISLGFELVATTFINVPGATFYGGRKTAYKFRCVKAQ